MTMNEVRTRYILDGSPSRVKNRLLRHVLTHDADGRPSLVVQVPNAYAVDVLDALRAAYQQGREDHAAEYAVQFESHRWYAVVRQGGRFLRAFADGREFSGLGEFETEEELRQWRGVPDNTGDGDRWEDPRDTYGGSA
jgi:hypothetical protein